MVKHRTFIKFISLDRGLNSWPRRRGPGHDPVLTWYGGRCPPGPYIMKAHGHFGIQPPGTGLNHLQPRPGSFGIEPTGHRIDFCESAVLNIVL
jgi:hypothetical protein